MLVYHKHDVSTLAQNWLVYIEDHVSNYAETGRKLTWLATETSFSVLTIGLFEFWTSYSYASQLSLYFNLFFFFFFQFN